MISQRYQDDLEHPIAFASRTLTPTEQKYAQVEKETLALVFGVKCFHQYLYGRNFMLITDHKPLTSILGPHQAIPSSLVVRLQRCRCTTIRFSSALQRSMRTQLLHLPPGAEVSVDAACYNLGQIQAVPVTAAKLGT